MISKKKILYGDVLMKVIIKNKILYKCFTCKEIKTPDNFYTNKTSKCKSCFKIVYLSNKSKLKKYYIDNKERFKTYYKENRDRIYLQNDDKIKLRTKIWKKNNHEKVLKQKRREKLRRSDDISKEKLLW